MPLTVGSRLGPYEILGALGEGGMGQVYRARDTRLGRTVAIKILHPSLARDPSFGKRFENEARTLSRIAHPNICVLHDVDLGDPSYLVLEFLEGTAWRSASIVGRCHSKRSGAPASRFAARSTLPIRPASSIATSSRRT